MPSDVIEAHVRRLPRLDRAAWSPRPVDRDEVERALLTGLVAGWATHPLDNVRGNAQLLLDHDPDKEFGLTGLQDGRTLDKLSVQLFCSRPRFKTNLIWYFEI